MLNYLKRRFNFHWQNLNEKGSEDVVGSILRHGRAWLYFGHGRESVFRWSWNLWSKDMSCQLNLATHEDAISGNVGCYLLTFYWGFEHHRMQQWIANKIKRPDETYGSGRALGVYWFSGSLVINLWEDPMESRSTDPWWWHMSITPVDLLLGRAKYSERVLKRDTRELALLEKTYPVQIELKEATWKRPRWPWPMRIMRAEIESKEGIPVPGKGENSWDCDEDATFGLTTPARTFDEALSTMYSTVMRQRERHGGKNWLPETRVA